MIDKSIRYLYAGGAVPPRRVEIKGQDHMLAYITPQEGELLRAQGGSGRPGPMGIPSFEIDPEDLAAMQERFRIRDKLSGIELEKEYGPQGPGGTYVHPEADPNYVAPSEPSSDVQDNAEALQEEAMESPPEALNPMLSTGPTSVSTNYNLNAAPVLPMQGSANVFSRPQGSANPFIRPQGSPNPLIRPQGSLRVTPGETLARARRIT